MLPDGRTDDLAARLEPQVGQGSVEDVHDRGGLRGVQSRSQIGDPRRHGEPRDVGVLLALSELPVDLGPQRRVAGHR
jgi:hypothetical protein